MPVKRNLLGRFEKAEENTFEEGINLTFSGNFGKKVFIFILILFVVSPWLFIIVKRNSIKGISAKVNEFYDDYFSCACASERIPSNKQNDQTTPIEEKTKGG